MSEDNAKVEQFDPGRAQLALTYAKALLGSTEAASKGDSSVSLRAVEELQSVVGDLLPKLPSLAAALRTPRLSVEDKTSLLDKAFAGRMEPILLRFLKVVARHGRLDCLDAIAISAKEQLDALHGRIEVQVRTAAPLSNPLRDRIGAKLGEILGKQVIIKATVQPDLLGGVVVRVGDTLLDGSLLSKLEKMRSSALDGASQAIGNSLGRFVTS